MLSSLVFTFVLKIYLTNSLFNQLDLTRAPGLLDPGLERAIHSQDGEPALSGNGFEPVALLARGRFRAEVDVVRTVGVLLRSLAAQRSLQADETGGRPSRTARTVTNTQRAGALERAPAPDAPGLAQLPL